MNTVTTLEMLLGALESRPRKNGVVPAAPGLSQQIEMGAPASPQSDPFVPQPQPAVDPPLPQVLPQSGPTEESLRSQLDQVDLYDLSGERAAAEALKREDAFKQQQIEEKAQQTKEFFAEQDRKQQETLQEVQKQADLQAQERSQKEFWDQKQSQEMQADMEKELRGLHEAALQEHQKWRDDFTQGVCREDVTREINKQIDDRTMAYHDRLNDIGTNPVDASETVSRYRVKLEDGAQGQIDQRTAELHEEHFSAAQSSPPGLPPDTPPGAPDAAPREPEPPSNTSADADQSQRPWNTNADADQSRRVGNTGPGITHPQDGPQLNMPGYGGREDMRPAPETNQPQQSSAGGPSGDASPPTPPTASPSSNPLPANATELVGAVAANDQAIDNTAAKAQADGAKPTDVPGSGSVAQTHGLPLAPDSITKSTGEQEFSRAKEMYGPQAEPPYRADAEVVTGQLERETVTSRMYNPPAGKLSHPISEQGGPERPAESRPDLGYPDGQPRVRAEEGKKVWSSFDDPVAMSKMTPAELKERGLTPQGLKDTYALPNAPTAIADRHHPDGQVLSVGEAGANKMGPGGGTQVEARGARDGERHTPGVDWNAEVEKWDVRPSAIFNRSSNPDKYGLGGTAGDGPGEPAPSPAGTEKIDTSTPVAQPPMSAADEKPASSLNPNLVDMYKQREIDLGHTNVEQATQKFATDVKQIDAQTNQPSIAPQTPTPTPTPTASPTPAPTPSATPTPPPQVAQPAPSLSL